MHKNQDILFEIDFQDFFSKDIVNLKLNECDIFIDTLTSDKSDGFTSMRLTAYQGKGAFYLIKYLNKSVKCDSKKYGLNLEIIMNGKENRFKVDIAKGKYLGFSKKNQSEVSITQSIKPFIYD